jgi:hypothetical protein
MLNISVVRSERPKLGGERVLAKRFAGLPQNLAVAHVIVIVQEYRHVLVGVDAMVSAGARAEQQRRSQP